MATKFVSALTGPEMDQALTDMAYHNSEAYAVGTRNGVAVGSSDVTYHNNSKYWAEQVYGYTDRAEDAANRAEAAVPAGTAGAVFFDRAQTLTTAQQAQARANIMAGGSNRNLLDNPWFTAGNVVNQRGFSSMASADGYKYIVDRWMVNNSGATLGSDGITIEPAANDYGLIQRIERSRLVEGETYTLSVIINGTLYTSTFVWNSNKYLPTFYGTVRAYINNPNNNPVMLWIVGRPGDSFTISKIKLELGSVSTLANDAPPDYGEELRKCMRYCQVYGRSGNAILNRYLAGFMSERANGRAVFWSPLLVEMRANPTVTNNGALGTRPVSATQNLDGSVYTFSTSKTGIYIIDTNSNITTSNIYTCATHNIGALLILSAEL